MRSVRAAIAGLVFLSLAALGFAREPMTEKDRALFGLAQSHNNLKKYQESILLLEPLHETYPDDRAVSLELARAYGFSGKLTQAQQIFSLLEKTDKDLTGLWESRASVWEANQRFAEAAADYGRLAQLHPQQDRYLRKQAELLVWMKDYRRALDIYEVLLQKNPVAKELIKEAAQAAFWSGQHERAIVWYEQLTLDPKKDAVLYKSLADSYAACQRFSQAESAYRALIQYSPDDLSLRQNLADMLLAQKKYQQGKRELTQMTAQGGDLPHVLSKLAELLAMYQDYDQAEQVCRRLLAQSPRDGRAKLLLARLLSWRKKYDESLLIYDDLLANHPEVEEAGREKARVLGWRRQFDAALDAYQQAYARAGDRMKGLIDQEKAAKKEFYRLYDGRAIRQYQSWLVSEPDDLEALFDLGQGYSRQMQWKNARETYGRILELMPHHFRAQEAEERVDLLSRHLQAASGVVFYEADSDSRQTDVRYADVYGQASWSLGEQFYASLREDNFFYSFSDLSRANRLRTQVSVDYHARPAFWASAGYAGSSLSDGLESTHEFFEQVHWSVSDPWLLTLSHHRNSVIENAATFKSRLYRDDYLGRLEWRPDRRLTVGAESLFSHYSDGNQRQQVAADMRYDVTLEPERLTLLYRYENYGFDFSQPDYFSPGSFHRNRLGLEWRHFLNSEELFWGEFGQTYYTLRYFLNLEGQSIRSHEFNADFSREWGRRWTSVLSASSVIYDHQDIYREQRIELRGQYTF